MGNDGGGGGGWGVKSHVLAPLAARHRRGDGKSDLIPH